MFPNETSYLQYYDQSNIYRKDQVPLDVRSQFFNNYVIKNVQSGGFIPTIYMGLIDKYG